MKAWIGSQDLMREHRSWVFWDGEWRHAWRPAVALTAGTTVHGDGRPGAQKDAVTRVGRHPEPEPLRSAFPVSSVLRIFYIHFPITQRSIRFQSRFIRGCLGGLFFPLSQLGHFKRQGRSSHLIFFSITVPKHSRFDVH